jgi:hypothetical protein
LGGRDNSAPSDESMDDESWLVMRKAWSGRDRSPANEFHSARVPYTSLGVSDSIVVPVVERDIDDLTDGLLLPLEAHHRAEDRELSNTGNLQQEDPCRTG